MSVDELEWQNELLINRMARLASVVDGYMKADLKMLRIMRNQIADPSSLTIPDVVALKAVSLVWAEDRREIQAIFQELGINP